MTYLYHNNLFTQDFFHKPTITSPSFNKGPDLRKPTNIAKPNHNLFIPKLQHLSNNSSNTKTKYANTDISESISKHISCKDTLNITPIPITKPHSNKTEHININVAPNNKLRKHYKNHLIRTINVNEYSNDKEDQPNSSRELNNQNKSVIININLPNCNDLIISAVSFPKKTECIICNKVFLEYQLVSTSICKHLFCQECISDYFQNKLLTSSTATHQVIKCPIYSCNEMFNIDIIKQNISKQFINYLDNVNSPIKYCIDEYNNIKCNSSNNNKSIYLNDHFLLINSNQSLYNYYNNKKEICPNCNLFSLHHKSGMKWLICFNCLKRFCYFCLKRYKKSHFNYFSLNRCKVFFRNVRNNINNNNNKSNSSFCFNYWLTVLYVFAGYFICWIGNIKNTKTMIKHCVLRRCETNNALLTLLRKLLYYISFTSVSVLLSVTMLILIPYFAIITSI